MSTTTNRTTNADAVHPTDQLATTGPRRRRRWTTSVVLGTMLLAAAAAVPAVGTASAAAPRPAVGTSTSPLDTVAQFPAVPAVSFPAGFPGYPVSVVTRFAVTSGGTLTPSTQGQGFSVVGATVYERILVDQSELLVGRRKPGPVWTWVPYEITHGAQPVSVAADDRVELAVQALPPTPSPATITGSLDLVLNGVTAHLPLSMTVNNITTTVPVP